MTEVTQKRYKSYGGCVYDTKEECARADMEYQIHKFVETISVYRSCDACDVSSALINKKEILLKIYNGEQVY